MQRCSVNVPNIRWFEMSAVFTCEAVGGGGEGGGDDEGGGGCVGDKEDERR